MELESYDCVLCHLDTEETLMHLFFQCPFRCLLLNTLGLAPLIQDDLLITLSAFRTQLHQPFFMEIIICMCWAIWATRKAPFGLLNLGWNWLKNIVLAELLWEKNLVPAEKTSRIWGKLNGNIFRSLQHSVSSCKTTFRRELALVKLRAKNKYQTQFDQWLEGYV